MDSEEKSDTQLREQFKEKWTRTQSAQLTKPIREEATKYSTILSTATQADAVVREKFDKHKEGIVLLSKPLVRDQSTFHMTTVGFCPEVQFTDVEMYVHSLFVRNIYQ